MSELNHPLALSGDAGIATVYDQGAHVASWTPFGHDPVLFVSRRSGFQVGRSCLLYTSPSPRDKRQSRMPSSA